MLRIVLLAIGIIAYSANGALADHPTERIGFEVVLPQSPDEVSGPKPIPEHVTAHVTVLEFDHDIWCPACGVPVRDQLRYLPGVFSVELELRKGTASITFDPEIISARVLQHAADDYGFPAKILLDVPVGNSACDFEPPLSKQVARER